MHRSRKPKVYIETSIPSYLTARQSRDLIIAGNQRATKTWWWRRRDFEIFVSVIVLDEAAVGDPTAAAERLKAFFRNGCSRRNGLPPHMELRTYCESRV
jgi:hypothetical protein